MAYFNQLLKIKWNKTMQSSILTLHIDLSKCDWNTINVGVIHMCLSLFFFLGGGGFLKDVWTGNSPLRFIK